MSTSTGSINGDLLARLVACHRSIFGLAVLTLAAVHATKPWLAPKRLMKATRIFNRDKALVFAYPLIAWLISVGPITFCAITFCAMPVSAQETTVQQVKNAAELESPSLQKGTAQQSQMSKWLQDFDTEIRPLLTRRCGECHGTNLQEGDLRLDNLAALRVGGGSGEPAILPGNSAASHLIKRILAEDTDQRMPPDGDPLAAQDVDLIRDWIDRAREWPEQVAATPENSDAETHWSFLPVHMPSLPDGEFQNAFVAIDRFIQQRLINEGLYPNVEADKHVLIRRIYLDVLGIPPSPEVVDAFVLDNHPNSYARLVDRVLSHPAYGERWGSYWLDLVRFAETDGFETNRERPNAWPYRDYVIQSLNQDKPYNDFLIEQLAGDQLGVPTATAYLVAGTRDIVKSPDVVLTLTQRQNELDDMINTTGSVMLGMTLGCARCHNHKFDPVTQQDYYAMQAVFAGVQHGERSCGIPEDRSIALEQIEAEIALLEAELKPYATQLRPAVTPTRNVEQIEPTLAKFLLFAILQTNSGEPCIDEIEIFAGDQNLALADRGAAAISSGNLTGYDIHRLSHIIDGRYGNNHSWISDTPGTGWIEIQWPEVQKIDKIVWARDREGVFADRLITKYKILVSTDGKNWQTISTSEDRIPFGSDEWHHKYELSGLPPELYKQTSTAVQRLRELQQESSRLNQPMVVYAGNFEQPGETRRLFRGDPLSPREVMEPDTVACLGQLPLDANSPESERRMRLAEWIASPENPLTARVAVNRLWQHHFSNGIVATPSDFGRAGVAPSHPELLDYLAWRLIDQDWSLKAIHREILLSHTYRQSSEPNIHASEVDAGNQLLWRFAPRRLEAEAVRDSVLSVCGTLSSQMEGPGYSAFEVELENVRHYHPKSHYGPSDWRRMIYMTKVRQEKESVFGIFDCPDGAASVPVRSRSTTPLQALNLFNSPFMLQQAELFAESLQRDAGNDAVEITKRAFANCFSRAPEQHELDAAKQFIASYGVPAFCRAILNSNEFVFIQ